MGIAMMTMVHVVTFLLARLDPEATSLPTITLMQADEVGRPFHRNDWIYEEKYDGWRVVAYTRRCCPLVSVSAQLVETALE